MIYKERILMSPLKAIREKCLDCSCGQMGEVRECVIRSCALYLFRMGHREKVEGKPKRVLSEAHKAAMQAGRKTMKEAV